MRIVVPSANNFHRIVLSAPPSHHTSSNRVNPMATYILCHCLHLFLIFVFDLQPLFAVMISESFSNIVSYHAISYCHPLSSSLHSILFYHNVPKSAISYHIMPYYIISYYIISYLII